MDGDYGNELGSFFVVGDGGEDGNYGNYGNYLVSVRIILTLSI